MKMKEVSKEETPASNGTLYKAGLHKTQNSLLNVIFQPKSIVFVFLSLIFGLAAKGEGALFAVLLWKNWEKFYFFSKATDENLPIADENSTVLNTSDSILEDEDVGPANSFQDLPYFIASAMIVSQTIFLGIGGYLQWKYYVKQKSTPEEWKCQPKKFLTDENERHEFWLGETCLILNSIMSGVGSCYIHNTGYHSKVYFDINEYGWIYFIFSTVLLFLIQDALSYYYHRMLHWPIFYKTFHKWHHRYHSPTAWSAVAMHPVESLVFELFLFLPLLMIPFHFVSVVIMFHYLFYFGLIDHSGIDMDSIWPWQPPVRFHDDHHRYFHVNFGFNTMIFDKFHDTLRTKSRTYGEDIFYGKGAEKKSN